MVRDCPALLNRVVNLVYWAITPGWKVPLDSGWTKVGARAEGYREMAGRMAHVVSGSVYLAKTSLEAIDGDSPELSEDVREKISTARAALEQAEQGFMRARLLDIPWNRYGENIGVPNFLEHLVKELNSAAGPVEPFRHARWPSSPLHVYAARHRPWRQRFAAAR